MATKKNVTTTSDLYAAPAVEADIVEDFVDDEPVVVAPGSPSLKKARIKGTWKMFWGQKTYDFVDGKTFNIPVDLYNYLRVNGNIYDTLG